MLDAYLLVPSPGTAFDVEAIRAHLGSLTHVVPEPRWPGRGFLFCASARAAREVAADLAADAESPRGSLGGVMLSPDSIQVYQEAGPGIRGGLQAFVQWVRAHYPCVMRDRAQREIRGGERP